MNVECPISKCPEQQSFHRSANGLEETQRLSLKIRLSEIGKFRT
jgi:hypothetical protein